MDIVLGFHWCVAQDHNLENLKQHLLLARCSVGQMPGTVWLDLLLKVSQHWNQSMVGLRSCLEALGENLLLSSFLWQNSVPCSLRLTAPFSLSAVSQGCPQELDAAGVPCHMVTFIFEQQGWIKSFLCSEVLNSFSVTGQRKLSAYKIAHISTSR